MIFVFDQMGGQLGGWVGLLHANPGELHIFSELAQQVNGNRSPCDILLKETPFTCEYLSVDKSREIRWRCCGECSYPSAL